MSDHLSMKVVNGSTDWTPQSVHKPIVSCNLFLFSLPHSSQATDCTSIKFSKLSLSLSPRGFYFFTLLLPLDSPVGNKLTGQSLITFLALILDNSW